MPTPLRLTLAIALALPTLAAAEDAGLLVGNADYELAEPLRRGARILRAEDDLSRANIDVQAIEDADRGKISEALRQLEQQSRSAEGLLVALSGRFVFSDAETWFLPVEAEGASLIDTAMGAIPVSAVLSLLSNTPGRAVLVLATDLDRRDAIGGGLRHGVGPLDIPQGVTVIRAEPDEAEAILSDTLARTGQSIRARVRDTSDAWVEGFVTPDLAFLPSRPKDVATVPDRVTGPDPRETALWDRARRADTEEALVEFLVAYPDGAFADRAEARLDEIRNDPTVRAEKAEAALGLDAAARAEIQRDLVLLGFDTRGIDGVFGPGTRGAIGDWQRRNDRAVTGFLDRAQIDAIDTQAARRAAELEEEARRRAELEAAAEEAYWVETGEGRSENGIERFLDRYPDGAFADEARRRLAALRDDTGGGRPDERSAWRDTRAQDTIAAYETFLDRYPGGRFADRARERLAALRDAEPPRDRQAEATEQALGLNAVTRQAVEQRLAAEGFDPGRVDGTFDAQTRTAIRGYQRRAQLPQTGYLNQITVVRLLADTVRRVLQ